MLLSRPFADTKLEKKNSSSLQTSLMDTCSKLCYLWVLNVYGTIHGYPFDIAAESVLMI